MNIVMPYYENAEMLRRHANNWRKLKPGARIVIVDDGSPTRPAEDVLRDAGTDGLDVRLLRIDVDIPWNTPGARNLGMMHVQGWTLLTDIDRMIEPQEWKYLLAQRMAATEFYALHDRTTGHGDAGTHPGTFVILPELYWAAGGFNEDFARHYGYDDIAFRKVARRMARERLLPIWITAYSAADVPDARTNSDRHNDPAASKNVPALMDLVEHPRQAANPLRFPWHEVTLRG